MNYKINSTGNTIVADQAFMDSNYPGDYTPISGTDTTPAEPTRTKMTKLAFRNRFTQAEKTAIEFASIDNPAAPTAQRMAAASLRASMADQRDAEHINPQRPDTRKGVFDMQTYGLIAAGRALQILDAPISLTEEFHG